MRPIRIALIVIPAVIILLFALSSVYVIETGNVGVYRSLGEISKEEVPPGLHFRWPLISSVQEFSAKEIQIDLNDMKPKASDNLSLRDFDVTVYYTAAPSQIADLRIKYALPLVGEGGFSGVAYPAYELVRKQARSAAYEAVSQMPSLEIHTRRGELENNIRENVQAALDKEDPGVFVVSRTIVRAVVTDPSVEKAIQQAVSNEKKLEAKKVQVEIAKKDAEIEIARARGIAESNRIINDSLTPEYLQHELNKALSKFAENGNGTVVIPANMGNVQMMLPTAQLGARRK